ncbi:MAG: outer membrane protein transport protein [Candidatus Riflebacteria bacterium]|nr:outer membrane protein transport protein [Candidatus Riflebacteria bacterium]
MEKYLPLGWLKILMLGFLFFNVPLVNLFASGFGLLEHSAAAMGTCYSGGVSGGNDLTDMFYNPAALSLHSEPEVTLGFSQITTDSKFKLSSSSNVFKQKMSGNAGGANIAPQETIPSLFANINGSSETRFGISINGPWGLESNNPNGWVGRYYALNSKVASLNITPTISHKIGDSTYFGCGLQVQKMTAELSAAIDFGSIGAALKIPTAKPGLQDGSSKISGDSWGTGFTCGILSEISQNAKIGLSYRSSIKNNLSGNSEFTLDSSGIGKILSATSGAFKNCGVTSSITTPESFSFGMSGNCGKFGIQGSLSRTRWSCFKELRVNFDNRAQAPSVLDEKWRDTSMASFGLTYAATDRLILRTGVSYDESPVPNLTRNPSIPDSSRHWFSFGMGFKATENTTLELGFAHLSFDDAPVDLLISGVGNQFRGNLIGDFTTSVNILSLQAARNF